MRGIVSIVVWFLALAVCDIATAQQRNARSEGFVENDVYIIGPSVDIAAEVDGDILAAGGRVAVGNIVHGDVMAAGGIVDIFGVVEHAVRVAGGRVTIAANIGHDLVAAGGTVRVDAITNVARSAWLAGGHVEVAGRIGGNLKIAAATIAITGEIEGDVEAYTERLTIGRNAVILGRITYRSALPAEIDPSAQIGGKVERDVRSERERGRGIRQAAAGGFGIVFGVGMFLLGLAFYLVFPRHSMAAAHGISDAPWPALGVGLALFAAPPIVIVIGIASVIGVVPALIIAAIYLVSLPIAILIAALFLGDAALRAVFKRHAPSWLDRLAMLAITIAVFALLGAIPTVGKLALLLLLLFGLGAWYRELWSGPRAA